MTKTAGLQYHDTTSIGKASIRQASIRQPSVGQLRQLVKYVDWSSRKGMRRFVK